MPYDNRSQAPPLSGATEKACAASKSPAAAWRLCSLCWGADVDGELVAVDLEEYTATAENELCGHTEGVARPSMPSCTLGRLGCGHTEGVAR